LRASPTDAAAHGTCILDHADDGFSADWIADQFEVPVDVVKRVLAYARAAT
jgi:hypothetical protein